MKDKISNHKTLIIICLIWFLAMTSWLFTHQKGDLVILLNQRHNAFLDIVFKNATLLGEGYSAIGLSIFLIWRNKFHGLIMTVGLICNAAIAQFLKRVIFTEHFRPSKVLGEVGYHFVEGVELHSNYSFPSGHTNAGFTMMVILSLLSKNKNMSIVYMMVAILIGFSRMYLFQHFEEDVLAGSVIAVMFSFLIYFGFKNFTQLEQKLQPKSL